MAVSLPDFPSFDIHTELSATGLRWKKWVERFENLLVVIDIAEAKRKKALLLHYAGPDVQEVYETFA